jgi:hypothetical protein
MIVDRAIKELSVNHADQARFAGSPHFDHAFATVSADTLKLINECEFLRREQFGRFAIRASESSLLGSYMPTRVYGRTNCVEIFPDKFGGNDKFIEHLGGIVLTFGHPGEMVQARKHLQSAGINFSGEVVERVTPDVNGGPNQVLRYHFTRPDMGGGSPIAVFLHEIEPSVSARTSATGRPDRTTRFDASLGRTHTPDQVMEDILGVTVWLRPDRIERAAALLATLGCETTALEPGVRVTGVDAELNFLADGTHQEGTVELKIKLSRSHPGRSFDFGTESSLVLSPSGPEDFSATWTFFPHR